MLPAKTPRRFANLNAVPNNIETLQIGNYHYPTSRIEEIHNKLATPKYVLEDGVDDFYKSPRVQATMELRESSYGEASPGTNVSFMTHYPETGWTADSPTEMGIVTASPKPVRDLAQLSRAFQDKLNTNSGRGVLINNPLSDHRGKAYEKMGFVDAGEFIDAEGNAYRNQVLDNRRFKNSSAVAQMNLLTDPKAFGDDIASSLSQGIVQRHPQLNPANTLVDSGADELFNLEQAINRELAAIDQNYARTNWRGGTNGSLGYRDW
jgi:hypothetical protein